MHINYSGEIETAKEKLSKALGNVPMMVDILREISGSDEVDLLFYDKKDKSFYDKMKGNVISLSYLEGKDDSMLSKAYQFSSAYYCPHTHFDKHYNVSIDNPYKVHITSQIIMPLSIDHEVLGIIRLSKFKYIFEIDMLRKLLELESTLVKIFREDIGRKVEEFNVEFFSVGSEKAFNIIDKIKTELKLLADYTRNPEINKLIANANENIEAIFDYLNPTAYIEQIEQESKKPVIEEEAIDHGKKTYHVLFADDVEMNLRILSAMIKGDKRYKISTAKDGIETLHRIEEAKFENDPVEILFLDHYMPGKLGLEVARSIRDDEAFDDDTPIAIVSITNDPAAIESHKHLYDYHLSKPFDQDRLVEILEDIRSRAQLSQQ